MSKHNDFPCPRCGGKSSVYKKKGKSRLGTLFYREEFVCKACDLRMSGRQPGSAEQFWKTNTNADPE